MIPGVGVGNSAGVGVAPTVGRLTPPPDCTVGVAAPPGAEPPPPPPPLGLPAVEVGAGVVVFCVLVLAAEACRICTRSTTAAITTAPQSSQMGKSRQRP